MSSKGQFQDFDFDQHKPNTNMEDILDKVDKFSIDWDNFDAPNNNNTQNSRSHSAVSDIFNKSKKSQSQRSQRKDIQDSRDIMQISMIGTQNNQRSFRFQKEDSRQYPQSNQRYSRLQTLLEAAKRNSLEQFYKNIDQQNNAYRDQPQKFTNYPQFKDYIKQLKKGKKQKELQVAQRQMNNPFATLNSNKIYTTSYLSTNKFGTGNSQNNIGTKYQLPKMQQPQAQRNFSKKPTLERVQKADRPERAQKVEKVSDKYTGNFLPNQFAQQNFFETQEPAQAVKNNPVAKYHNFYEGGQKLPEKAPQHNRQQDAFQFFEVSKKDNDKKQKQSKRSLQPIRQEKHNSFERTFEQQKLDNLLKNYQVMRKDFQQLMGNLKSTSEGQQKIVTEIRKLKQQKNENQIRQQRRQRKQRELQQKNKKLDKLDTIKDQINKIKSADKDILFSQINKKIEQLQSVVRTALQEINEQKQAKIVPKITNYFCDHQAHFRNVQKEFQNNFDNQDNEGQAQEDRQKYMDRSHDQSSKVSKQLFTQNVGHLQVKNQMLNSPSQQSSKKQLPKNQKQSRSKQISRQRSANQMSRKSVQSGSRYREPNINNFFSPLDLPLQGGNFSRSYSQQMISEEFTPQQFAQQHFPRDFQGYNKNLRNCLSQKSSVVYESFDFHVSSRFSVVDDPIHPIVAAMRVGNKCSIDLYDVHCIIYGPQGPGISTDPSTVFQQQVKKNSSFAFQVSVDKSCIQDNGYSIQISYKTDSMSKKKINFKVPLPLLQLIRPQFVYQQKFLNDWHSLTNQSFIRPQRLDSTYLRSHQDLKLIMPFIQLSQEDPDSFAYGLMFRYPKSDNVFYMKVTCYVSGKAAIQMRAIKPGDKKLKQQILNVFNFILFTPA